MKKIFFGFVAFWLMATGAWGQSTELKFILADARGCQMIFPMEGNLARARLGKVSDATQCVNKKIEGSSVFGMETVMVSAGVPWSQQFVQARFFSEGMPSALFVSVVNMPDGSMSVSVGGRNYFPKDRATTDLMLARIKLAASNSDEADFLIKFTRAWMDDPAKMYAQYARDWGNFVVSQSWQGDDPKARGRVIRGG